MKKTTLLFTGLSFALLFAACSGEQKQAETTPADAASATGTSYVLLTDTASRVFWKGSMVGVYSHTGTANFKEGSISVNNGQLTGGNFTVDMTSLKATDANYDPKQGRSSEKLLGHLASPDFFDVANNPTATFTINNVSGNEATGTFKVRGKENQETVKNITVTEANGTVTAKGTLTFDRKKYDVNYDVTAKDMLLSNDIELEITLAAKK